MLYLASQFVWFLLAAFALGLVMGWIGRDGGRLELWSGKLVWVAAAWGLGAAATWTQTLNGVAALWVETALLFLAVYAAGCIAAAVLKTAAERDGAAVAPANVAPAIVEPAGTIDDGKTVIKDIKGVAKTAVLPVAVANEEALPGQRPVALAAARADKPDDLKLIKGIGRQNEGRLHGLGIWHFDQIAAWTAENVEWVGGYLAFPGRIEREDWVGQARALASGAATEFARRAKSGAVASSRDDGSAGQGNVTVLRDGEFDGEKPGNLLAAARDGKPDDLILIKGIGPVIAADLNRLGIWHFDQIAALREPELRYLCAFADIPAANARTWREDADILEHGGETAHSRALKAERGKN